MLATSYRPLYPPERDEADLDGSEAEPALAPGGSADGPGRRMSVRLLETVEWERPGGQREP